MSEPLHLKLRIETLEASNLRLRKHLKQAKQLSNFPSSTKLTNCMSEEVITEYKSTRNLEESSMSLNSILNKGMEYIVQRYESDIRSIISYLEGRTKIDNIYPFSSDSPKLFEQLLNKVYKLKIDSKGNSSKFRGKSPNLNKLIGDYNTVVTDNESKCRLILDMEEIIQRLYYQEEMSKVDSKVSKIMAEAFAENVHRQFDFKPINRMRSVVNGIRFCHRLNKVQRQVQKSISSANLKLVESPLLYSRLYKSYCYGFQYTENQGTIKRYITKNPQKSIMKLLNHPCFFSRIPPRSIGIRLKAVPCSIKKQQQQTDTHNQIKNLRESMKNTLKLYQEQRHSNSLELEEYKEKVRDLNLKVTNLQLKVKKVIRSK